MVENPRVYNAEEDVSAEAERINKALEQVAGAIAVAEKPRDLPSGAGAGAGSAVMADASAAATIEKAAASGKRAFVFPLHINFKQLVRAGTEPSFELQARNPGTYSRRFGDVWLHVQGGILIIDPDTEEGALQLEWCEANPSICRDAMEPQTEIWAALKEAQTPTPRKEPSLPQNIDVDKVMAGDMSGFMEAESIAARARRMLATQS